MRMRMTCSNETTIKNAPLEVLRDIARELEVENPEYLKAKKDGTDLHGVKRRINLSKLHYSSGITFPRGYTAACWAFLEERKLGVEVVDEMTRLPPVNFAFRGELTDKQSGVASKILERDFVTQYIHAPEDRFAIAASVIARRRQPTLILAHGEDLLEQWLENIPEYLWGSPGVISKGRWEVEPVTVGSFEAINARRYSSIFPPQSFGQLIVDKCDKVPPRLLADGVTAFDTAYICGLYTSNLEAEDLLSEMEYWGEDTGNRTPGDFIFRHLGNPEQNCAPKEAKW